MAPCCHSWPGVHTCFAFAELPQLASSCSLAVLYHLGPDEACSVLDILSWSRTADPAAKPVYTLSCRIQQSRLARKLPFLKCAMAMDICTLPMCPSGEMPIEFHMTMCECLSMAKALKQDTYRQLLPGTMSTKAVFILARVHTCSACCSGPTCAQMVIPDDECGVSTGHAPLTPRCIGCDAMYWHSASIRSAQHTMHCSSLCCGICRIGDHV